MTPPPQVPYIGSTISLLSKASIRYEGFLYTIDQKESSVALSHVKVFGTEDRQCDRPVPPSDEIFEFIIFRASDITELKVIDTPPVRSVPDPAIIRAQNKAPPPSSGSDQQQSSAAAEANASVKNFLSQAGPGLGAVSRPNSSGLAVGSSGSGVGSGGSGAARLMGSSDAFSGRQSNRQQQQQQQQQQQHQSRGQQPPLMQGQPSFQQPQQIPPRRYNNQQQQDNKPFSGDYQPSSRSYYNNRRNNGDFFDMPNNRSGGRTGRSGYGYCPQGPPPLQSLQPMPPPPPHYRNAYGGGPAYSGYHNQQQHHPGYGYSMAPPPIMSMPPPMSAQRRYGGRPVMHFRRYPGAPGGGGSGGGGGGGRMSRSGPSNSQQQQHCNWNSSDRRQQSHHHQQHRQPLIDPIPARFTADYDFETANAEMEAELAKLVLGGGRSADGDNSTAAAATTDAGCAAATSADHGESDVDSKAHLASTVAAVESMIRRAHAGYNKEKSFFDDISRVETDEPDAAAAAAAAAAAGAAGSRGAANSSAGAGAPGSRKETTIRQNALNKETFGLVGGRMRRGIGNRFYGNRGPHRRAAV